MTTKYFIIVILGFTIISCGSKEKASKASDRVAGAYAWEVSFPVTNLENGKEIGIGTIRDTIFIRPVEEGYEVSNRKWRLNDYDKEGWRSMEHSEDKPLPNYVAYFSEADASLRPKNSDMIPPLYVDLSKQTIFRSKTDRQYYQKVR